MRDTCENGHSGVELRDNCLVCGAPQCCPVCCREERLEALGITEQDVAESMPPKPWEEL